VAPASSTELAIEELHARAFSIPTDTPESDGTLSWDSTTIVIALARAGGRTGLGLAYTAAAAADEADLFVDANGAYSRKQALTLGQALFEEAGISWFEEPVSSDDLEGLHMLRERLPAPVRVAAGEYGYDLSYFRAMLQAGAVDVLQADVTRCGGITGLLQVGARSARRSRSGCQLPRAPPSTRTCVARSNRSCTSSTSTITRASRRCCSTGCPTCSKASCGQIPSVRVTG
jgi:L-alanine-DL-glutamate epimerase-like enolase superfamily enzyme